MRRPDGKLPRGLSANQMRIGVGVDDGGRSIYIHEGFGKAGKTKTRAAFSGCIENEMEKAALVLDRAIRYPKTLRFRECYMVK